MGEQIIGSSKQPETKPNGGTGGNSTNPSTGSTTSGTGTGTGTGGTTSTASREKTKLPELAVLNEPKIVPVEVPGAGEPPKKKRGRPAGSTAAKNTAAKPVKAAAAPTLKADSTQIKLMLITISGIAASRPGMEVWNLTMEEADALAAPLSNMMAKNEALGKALGEHADAVALLIACFTIFVPKFLMWRATRPKPPKEGEKVSYVTNNSKPAKPSRNEGTPAGDNKPNVGRATDAPKTNGQNFGGQLSGLVPTIAGF